MDNMRRRMDSYFQEINKEIGTNEDIPIEQIIEFISKQFRRKWKTSFLYKKKNVKKFDSKPLNNTLMRDIDFTKFIAYISNIYDYLLTGDTHGIEEWIIKEVEEWEIKGGMCIYLSVLLYSLLSSELKICTDCLRYVQGFYRHDIREDYPSFFPWAGQHNGIHSWITLDDSIIDIAIRQQEYFFDFKGKPFVLGDIPEGLTYMGFIESKVIVNGYIREILDFSKMHYDTWIRKHTINALKVTISDLEAEKKHLENIFNEIKTNNERNRLKELFDKIQNDMQK